MGFFDLPKQSQVHRVVPKNAFDKYTNTKTKKLFTDHILRITWANKLSPETVNLKGDDITEIQVFKIELKNKTDIPKILDVIDKAIPYAIIFWIEFEDEAYVSTSVKHPHPTNPDVAVVDWTFTSDWFDVDDSSYQLNLTSSLDAVYKDFCLQLNESDELKSKTLGEIVDTERKISTLNREIEQLKRKIASCKQFNKKVELNQELRKNKRELDRLL